MSDAAPLVFGTVLIVGGGCYGTFYTRQLLAAEARGKVTFDELWIVDQDPHCQYTRDVGIAGHHRLVVGEWDEFLDEWLSTQALAPAPRAARPPDMLVPSPLMPHVLYHWLLRRARTRWPGRLVETRPLATGPHTPYDAGAPDGARYVSHADWTCPVHCIEPATCPVTRAPRSWDMAATYRQWAADLGALCVDYHCAHQVFGVGMIAVPDILAGDRQVAEAGNRADDVAILVGTHSCCHGAAQLLHLGAGEGLILRPPELSFSLP